MTRGEKQKIKTAIKYTTLIVIGIGLTIMVNKIMTSEDEL